MSDEVIHIIGDVDLLPLVDCSLTMFNTTQLYIFVEQQHKETSLFHLHLVKWRLPWMMSSASSISPLQVTSLPLLSLTKSLHVLRLRVSSLLALRDVSNTCIKKYFPKSFLRLVELLNFYTGSNLISKII